MDYFRTLLTSLRAPPPYVSQVFAGDLLIVKYRAEDSGASVV